MQHRQIALERRRAEVLVDVAEAGEHRAKVVRADTDHRRQPDRRVHRIAPADPVPEAEHVGGVDAEGLDLGGVGRDGDEMLRHRLRVAAETGEQPVARRLRVGHRLQRGEGLRRDDEQRLSPDRGRAPLRRNRCRRRWRRSGTSGRGRCNACSASNAITGPRSEPPMPMLTMFVTALAGVAGPGAGADAFGEAGHPVQHRVDGRHDVLAVDDDRGAFRRAQRDVQHRAVFRDVDPVAAEHRVDTLAQAALLGELHEQRERSRR